MALQIDSIEPASGTAGDEVTLRGTLTRAQTLIWGEDELDETFWEGGLDESGDESITLQAPDGTGTIQVLAANGTDRSNAVSFTYT
ncbi:hypothetical protein ADK70_31805 [Streptomyces rimosus subsp. pseudoverticillatus]|uniref:IPT/TIG domain-containing protein n=1 Tax=Streptomyces rimosus TaxID=1927 RepID=UPI0006B27D13|nr:IPT/TIG domain-containing protein [Streptomyces rimosus]KOT79103.1 hypothetical protein ADK70_31805 [Streptomyces rimosus subsp. pseudoverticillatus]